MYSLMHTHNWQDDAAKALHARRNGQEAHKAQHQVKHIRNQFCGDMGDRYERGPDVRMGKNKGGGYVCVCCSVCCSV